VKLTIEIDDREPVEVEVHNQASRLRMRELALLEKLLGLDAVDDRLAQRSGFVELQRMVMYAQLVGPYGPLEPEDLPFDEFDPEWGDVNWPEPEPEQPEAVVVPMVLPDGTEVEGTTADPTMRPSAANQ